LDDINVELDKSLPDGTLTNIAEVSAPISSNMNNHNSAFGGSIYSIGVLCGFSLVSSLLPVYFYQQTFKKTVYLESFMCSSAR
jgi:hypothetical protein